MKGGSFVMDLGYNVRLVTVKKLYSNERNEKQVN